MRSEFHSPAGKFKIAISSLRGSTSNQKCLILPISKNLRVLHHWHLNLGFVLSFFPSCLVKKNLPHCFFYIRCIITMQRWSFPACLFYKVGKELVWTFVRQFFICIQFGDFQTTHLSCRMKYIWCMMPVKTYFLCPILWRGCCSLFSFLGLEV